MTEQERLTAGLRYLEQQKKADPLESFRSLEGLKGAYERRVQPIINNAMQTFETGGAIGDLLRAYGSAAAPANAAVLEGMGMPYRGPITAPRQEGVSSGENFRAMGDPRQQAVGQMIGDPANLAQPVGARLANALKFAKPDAMKMVQEMSRGAISPVIDTTGLPNRGRDLIRRKADELADTLNKQNFEATAEYSGSAAGPSAYVYVSDPQTGRYISYPARFSGHSKGQFQSQFVHEMSDDPQSTQRFIDLAKELRAEGPTELMQKQGEAEKAAMQMRYKSAQKKIAKGKSLTNSEQEAVNILGRE